MHTLTRRRLTERHRWLHPIAIRVHQARRHAAWLTSGTSWATRAAGSSELPVRVKKHGSLLLRELSPDEMALQHNKVVNLRLASARTDGVVIRPGETFSFIDRRTGDAVGEELLMRNRAVVKYPPPEHLVHDLGTPVAELTHASGG